MRRARWHFTAVLLALGLARSASAQNLVTNGNFETGDFTGWTLTGNTLSNGVGCGPGYIIGSSQCLAFFNSGNITQTITTAIGTSYAFSFKFLTIGPGPSSFSAAFGATTVLSLVSPPAAPLTQYSYVVTATSASTVIAFDLRDERSFLYLDDVQVMTTVPEPSTYALMASGLLAIAFAARRRRRAS